MEQQKVKILFLGLYGAGKTSFLQTLASNPNNQLSGTIKGLNRIEVKVLGFSITLFDFGGIKAHMDAFLEKKENYIKADLIFYIIDTRDRQKFGESIGFFENLIKELDKNQAKPEIIVCFHKCDPEVMSDSSSFIHENLQYVQKLIKTRSKKGNFEFFLTSTYDYSSLIRAFSIGLIKIFKDPNQIMDIIFDDFKNKTNVNGICLLDHDALVLFKLIDQNKQFEEIIDIAGANLSQMSEKLYSYEIGFPNTIEIDMKGRTFFKTIEIKDKKRYYLIIYLEDIKNLDKTNQLLPNFTSAIATIIESLL